MRSGLLGRVINATNLTCRPSKALNLRKDILAFMKPQAVCSSPLHVNIVLPFGSVRPHASTDSCIDVSRQGLHDDRCRATTSTTGTAKLPISSQRKKINRWTEALEAYLPVQLRTTRQDAGPSDAGNGKVQRIHTLPLLLANARTLGNIDLLTYIGVYQGRWEAVSWLVKTMMVDFAKDVESLTKLALLPDVLWDSGQNLDQLTQSAIPLIPPKQSHISIDILTSMNKDATSAESHWRRRLGQVWQSLGCMVLKAEDRSVKDSDYQTIMSHVLQILAHLHHMNVFPASIYNYDPSNDPSVLQRPPTLYILSARIMSVLTDVAWKVHWEQEMEKAQTHGYDLPPPTVQPQMPHVGAEVWLDLILWACVEGGYIEEGVWIVTEMERRSNKTKAEWGVISWDEICQQKAPEPGWTALLKLQIDRSRLDQATGIGIASSGISSVEMGTRTISREVVEALMDGMADMTSARTELGGLSTMKMQQYISVCKRLAERHHSSLEAGPLNAMLLRIFESAVPSADLSAGVVNLLLHIEPTHVTGFRGGGEKYPAQSKDTTNMDENDYSAARLGLLYRNLHDYAERRNFLGAVLTFKRIQETVDQNRNVYIQEFASNMRERLKSGSQESDIEDGSMTKPPLLHPQIPMVALIAFFDLVTDSKSDDLGRWLLYNDDIDGGIINPSVFSEPNLQPTLLRYATATADDQLLTKVLENLQPPLSEPILHELLRCQTVLDKWHAVQGLLEHFQRCPGMKWNCSDAMAIAATVLKQSNSRRSNSTSPGGMLLNCLLSGKFNTPQDPSQLPDLRQAQVANQLNRILSSVSDIPISFESIEGSDLRLHKTTEIPAHAFNMLLNAVIENEGSSAGKRLWEKWCLSPGETVVRDFGPLKDRNELVVKPTLYMLRNITRPIVQKIRRWRAANAETEDQNGQDNSLHGTSQVSENLDSKLGSSEMDEDRSTLVWGRRMFQRFQLSNKEITAEIPPRFFFHRPTAGEASISV